MLAVSKIIDALQGKAKHTAIEPQPGLEKSHCLRAAKLLMEAEKFDFGNMMLEPGPNKGSWMCPQMTDEECDFWHQGYVPLPFPVCYYEFIMGGTPLGLLIQERDGDWLVERIDLVYNQTTVLYTGSILVARKNPAFMDKKETYIHFEGNMRAIEKDSASFLQIAVYLTLMLTSKTTEKTTVPRKLDKNRVRRGLAPLFAHRIVRIVPERFMYERNEATGEKRRSPRLHWRRSHLRHVEGKLPIVIARMLVGRAELGEVSHEYRVMQQPETEHV